MKFFNYRRVPYAEIRAFSVHILTASGSFLAFLGVVAAAEHRFVDMFWWLGLALLVDGIAIVQGTEHGDAARAYYEFVTSREALETAAEQFTRIPARTDIPADSLPEWVRRAREQITPMPLDRAMLAERLDEWMCYWDANIRNQYRGR